MIALEPYRIATDVGGTFTDLVIEGGGIEGRLFYKRPTTPDDPISGLLDTVAAAAADLGLEQSELLGQVDLFIHGTTRATNAIVMGRTAKTAYLCTKGHPDTLLWREGGGRRAPLDYTQEFPEPYVPRSLTFEVDERVLWDGTVVTALDEDAARATIKALADMDIEAVAVCLLWSIVNPMHELQLGELLAEELPGVPFTLSHDLNPTIREYRRASSAAIDASLKPLMTTYLSNLSERLAGQSFGGNLFILTSGGGVLGVDEIAEAPIHTIGSGPAAAPVAGLHFARLDAEVETAIVTDAGGTTFDVGLLRRGELPWTRETLVGDFPGYITGFPSVDVRSVGAGGGSIASVDAEGLLSVGPASAGAVPGPAAYGLGGVDATVTDACVVLGYIDPDYFLGGEIKLRQDLAHEAVARIANALELDLRAAAAAIYDLAIERMVIGIEDVTVTQGVDPRNAVLIAGGGGGGLYGVAVARSLGIRTVIVPEAAPALSATGALLSDLRREWAKIELITTTDFSFDRAQAILGELTSSCDNFVARYGAARQSRISYSVEARYENQHWEIEVPLPQGLRESGDLDQFVTDFHRRHEELFAHADLDSAIEIVTWRAQARLGIGTGGSEIPTSGLDGKGARRRDAYFSGAGGGEVPVRDWHALAVGDVLEGPVLIEAPTTTVVVPDWATARRVPSGSLVVHVAG